MIKIWDSSNKQWLEPMAIYFGNDNSIWKVAAKISGEDAISDGWYDFEGDDLKQVTIMGSVMHNIELIYQ